jgi:hypothetical protein
MQFYVSVGELLVASLKHPVESKNRALKVNSFTTTPNEALAMYERMTGGEKWDVSYVSLEELKEFETLAWNQNMPFATSVTLRRIWTEGGTLYQKRDNDIIKAAETADLKQAIETVIAAER